jgi:hypothetical protein
MICSKDGRLGQPSEPRAFFESLSEETQTAVTAALEALKSGRKREYLQPKHASGIGPFKELCVAYSQFSGDAAHATITALSRHWVWDNDGKTAYSMPWGSEFTEGMEIRTSR